MAGWVAGLIENITNSAQLRLGLGLSLAIIQALAMFTIVYVNMEGREQARANKGEISH